MKAKHCDTCKSKLIEQMKEALKDQVDLGDGDIAITASKALAAYEEMNK